VQLLALLLPKRFHFLFQHSDVLAICLYAVILALFTSFATSFLLLLQCLWRKQLGQAVKWLLVTLLGLGLAFFFYSTTIIIMMGSMGDGGPADARFHE
jgi:hypothetical protein